MSTITFLVLLAVLFGIMLGWGFKFLPGERWQMLAVVPLHKHDDQSWHGLNFTYYGFFIATSQLFSVVLLVILFGSLGISQAGALLTVFMLLAVCLPAARLAAMLVEKKRHTFTIGGAAFVGIALAPWFIYLSGWLLARLQSTAYLPLFPTLAALSICYTLGEGLGRLGCISYGCCYGKPLCQCSSKLQRLFRTRCFTFTGATKKAVYEGKFAGQHLIPIQAITAIIYSLTALLCCALFLHGRFTAALLCSITVSQGWRILSETLRADFRGFTKISAYQKMGLAALLYIWLLAYLLPEEATVLPSLQQGFVTLWQPGLILCLQLMWLIFFFWFGKSTVTTSSVSFQLLEERV